MLSEVAELLEVKDTTTSSFLMAMADLEDALGNAERDARSMRTAADASHLRSQTLLAEWKELELVKQQLEDAVEEREKHGTSISLLLLYRISKCLASCSRF